MYFLISVVAAQVVGAVEWRHAQMKAQLLAASIELVKIQRLWPGFYAYNASSWTTSGFLLCDTWALQDSHAAPVRVL